MNVPFANTPNVFAVVLIVIDDTFLVGSSSINV